MLMVHKSMENWSMQRKTCPNSITEVKFPCCTDFLWNTFQSNRHYILFFMPKFLNNCILCFTFLNSYSTFIHHLFSFTFPHTYLSMIITISYNTSPHCTGDWISRLEVLQTVPVYIRYQAQGVLKMGIVRMDLWNMTSSIQYCITQGKKKRKFAIPVYYCQLQKNYHAYTQPCPKVSKVLYVLILINFPCFLTLFIIAQKES